MTNDFDFREQSRSLCWLCFIYLVIAGCKQDVIQQSLPLIIKWQELRTLTSVSILHFYPKSISWYRFIWNEINNSYKVTRICIASFIIESLPKRWYMYTFTSFSITHELKTQCWLLFWHPNCTKFTSLFQYLPAACTRPFCEYCHGQKDFLESNEKGY